MNAQQFEAALVQIGAQPNLSQDAALSLLRQQGATITQAIKATRQLFSAPLGEAKAIVAKNPSWRQLDENAKELHADALEVLSDRVSSPRRAVHS